MGRDLGRISELNPKKRRETVAFLMEKGEKTCVCFVGADSISAREKVKRFPLGNVKRLRREARLRRVKHSGRQPRTIRSKTAAAREAFGAPAPNDTVENRRDAILRMATPHPVLRTTFPQGGRQICPNFIYTKKCENPPLRVRMFFFSFLSKFFERGAGETFVHKSFPRRFSVLFFYSSSPNRTIASGVIL